MRLRGYPLSGGWKASQEQWGLVRDSKQTATWKCQGIASDQDGRWLAFHERYQGLIFVLLPWVVKQAGGRNAPLQKDMVPEMIADIMCCPPFSFLCRWESRRRKRRVTLCRQTAGGERVKQLLPLPSTAFNFQLSKDVFYYLRHESWNVSLVWPWECILQHSQGKPLAPAKSRLLWKSFSVLSSAGATDRESR